MLALARDNWKSSAVFAEKTVDEVDGIEILDEGGVGVTTSSRHCGF